MIIVKHFFDYVIREDKILTFFEFQIMYVYINSSYTLNIFWDFLKLLGTYLISWSGSLLSVGGKGVEGLRVKITIFITSNCKGNMINTRPHLWLSRTHENCVQLSLAQIQQPAKLTNLKTMTSVLVPTYDMFYKYPRQ